MEKTVTLSKKTELHLMRKLWHLTTGLIFAVAYQKILDRHQMIIMFSVFFVLFLFIEILRLRMPRLNQFMIRYLKPIMRENEVNAYSGTVYYIAGMLISVVLFPKWIAILSLIFLALGDPMAAFLGTLLGDLSFRYRNGKSWIGSLGSAFSCFFFSLIYLGALPMSLNSILILSAGGAIGAAVAEAISSDGLMNDNLLIPVISGTWLYGAHLVLGVSLI